MNTRPPTRGMRDDEIRAKALDCATVLCPSYSKFGPSLMGTAAMLEVFIREGHDAAMEFARGLVVPPPVSQ